jgi:hypothetical protein
MQHLRRSDLCDPDPFAGNGGGPCDASNSVRWDNRQLVADRATEVSELLTTVTPKNDGNANIDGYDHWSLREWPNLIKAELLGRIPAGSTQTGTVRARGSRANTTGGRRRRRRSQRPDSRPVADPRSGQWKLKSVSPVTA